MRLSFTSQRGKNAGLTRDVDEEEQRDLALRAQLDEVRRLECGLREEDAVVRNDPYGVTVNVGKTLDC